MRLRAIEIVILLSLGILSMARSVWGFIKDTNVDITKSKSITGKVFHADIRKIKENTFKINKYKTVFAIQLYNTDQKFAVERGTSVCKVLDSLINAGDSIKIFYRSGGGDYNTHVFQIEKNNEVIINVKDYCRKESGMLIWAFIFGFVITAGTIIWMIRQKKIPAQGRNDTFRQSQ